MPVFRYRCPCGRARDELVSSPADVVPCGCGGAMSREFSPTTNLRLAEHARRENEDSRARQRAWMDTHAVRAKLRSGEYEIDEAKGDSLDGAGNSSSILARLEEGLPLS